MPAPAPPTRWTLDLLHALPDDGNRYELVDGALLVSPSPSYRHQRVAQELYVLLRGYVSRIGGHEVLLAPADVTFSDQREVIPDLFVLPLVDGRRAVRFSDVGRATLIVEVLSPSTARHDRVTKRRVYQEEHVSEYWIVDSDARAAERWRPGDERPEVLIDEIAWQPVPEHPALSIDLAALFGAALD